MKPPVPVTRLRRAVAMGKWHGIWMASRFRMARRWLPSFVIPFALSVLLLSACSSRTPTEPTSLQLSVPVITSQPRSLTVAAGSCATLTVEASGPARMAFQWFVGPSGDTTAPIGGASAASYTTPPLTTSTRYWVRVSADGQTADSTTATVAVTSASVPTIVEQPEDETVTAGQTARLSVEAEGPEPFAYQWFSRTGDTSHPIEGATAATYTTPPLVETTRYWVRVSNEQGSVDSVTVAVTVAVAPGVPPPAPPPSPPSPTPPPEPPPAPLPAHPSATSFENEVLTLINQRRAAGATCGGTAYGPVGPLFMNEQLRTASRSHSQDMAVLNYFSHTSLDGRTFVQRMVNAGYIGSGPFGENIAAGYGSAAAAVNGWMASPGHCQNIMNGSFRAAGVGYGYRAGSTYGHYWTMDFGGS